MTSWSAEQVIKLAPDPASAKAGRGLAGPAKWQSCGRSDRALWGEAQGSGKNPYQVRVDLTGPAFKCSCPSRKFPCKHALGLMLLNADQPQALTEVNPPAWLTDWLEQRDAKAVQKAAPAGQETTDRRQQDRARRIQQREARILAALDELELWLKDLIRQGLSDVRSRPYGLWDGMAARLVDGQAPGLARRVRGLATLTAAPDWAEALVTELGRLYLLSRSYRRLAQLPPELAADLRAAVGWTVAEEELGQGVRDQWQVVGSRSYREEDLQVRRTWLWGRTGRPALVLDFAHVSGTLPPGLPTGAVIDAELRFHPGAWPLRAVVGERHGQPRPVTQPENFGDGQAALDGYAGALARQPWLESYPVALARALPCHDAGRWWLRDDRDRCWPLVLADGADWELLAVSGDRPGAAFGEWDGHRLTLLRFWGEQETLDIWRGRP